MTEPKDPRSPMQKEIETTLDAAILIRGAIATIKEQATRLGQETQVSDKTLTILMFHYRGMTTALDNDDCPI